MSEFQRNVFMFENWWCTFIMHLLFAFFYLITKWVQLIFKVKLTCICLSIWQNAISYFHPISFKKYEVVGAQDFKCNFIKVLTTFKRCCPMTVRSISSYSIRASCSKLLHIISNLQWEIWRPPIVKIRDPFCPHCLTPFYASFSNQGSIKKTCISLN